VKDMRRVVFWRKESVAVPEVGAEAPEFNLPSAQGGQLRLSMRTARGPVAVVFYRPDDDADVEYFKKLAEREDEINLAAGSVVGIGVAEPHEARELVRASGIKSFVLYDYTRVTSAQWGLLERDKKNGDHTRPAVFLVSPDRKIVHAWTDGRPDPAELLAKVSEVSGLPKAPDEPKAEEPAADGEAEKPKKMSAEERERIKAERRAAREAGKSVKQPADAPDGEAANQEAPAAEAGAPPKMSKEERERIKAERRAARAQGKTLKRSTSEAAPGQANAGAASNGEAAASEAPAEAPTEAPAEAPKKMSKEERERQKAERRAAREAKAKAEAEENAGE
jgi:peroxiredoxin